MRLIFTCVSALLAASAGALWWVQGPGAVELVAEPPPPALERPLPEAELPLRRLEPEVAAPSPPAEVPVRREVPQAVEPHVAVVTESVELEDPGDFVLDTGVDGESESDVAAAARSDDEGSVDPERSAGWVERLLALYEVVEE